MGSVSHHMRQAVWLLSGLTSASSGPVSTTITVRSLRRGRYRCSRSGPPVDWRGSPRVRG